MTCELCNDTGTVISNRNPLGFDPGEREADCVCVAQKEAFFDLLWEKREQRRKRHAKTNRYGACENVGDSNNEGADNGKARIR